MNMATIKKYTKKDGSTAYMFQMYLGMDPLTGKIRKTTKRGFKTQKEAKLAASRLEHQVAKEGVPTQKQKIMTFGEIYDLFIPTYELDVKPSTFATQEREYRNHVLPKFKELKINKITPAYCQSIINEWRSEYKNFSNFISLASKVFEFAVMLKQIDKNPLDAVKRPSQDKTPTKETPFFSKKELESFMKTLVNYDIHYQAMIRLIAYTGMRKGELLTLQWSDLDSENRAISIKRTLAKDKNKNLIAQTPKTKASIRTIPIDEETYKLLNHWKVEQRKRLLALGFNANNKDQLMFSNDENGFLYMDYPNYFLKNFLIENDLPYMTIHGLRHTHCSILFEAGATIKQVQVRLGHKNIKTTMEIYAHVSKNKQNETADMFAKYLQIN